jgi:DNA replication protein DnaC
MVAASAHAKNSWWTSTEDFCNDCKAAIWKKIDPDAGDQAAKVPKLFLDDLGTERNTDHNIAVIIGLLRARFDRRLPTWITTNLTMDEIAERYTLRIADRIRGGCKIFELGGPSRRRQPA